MLTADEVLDTKFQATKFRAGYEQDAVDDFLDRVVAALRAREAGTPPTVALGAAEVAAVRFPTTKYREGYDQDEVDAFLDRIAQAFGGPAGPGREPRAPLAPSTLTGAASTPGLIDVGRGSLRGLFRRR